LAGGRRRRRRRGCFEIALLVLLGTSVWRHRFLPANWLGHALCAGRPGAVGPLGPVTNATVAGGSRAKRCDAIGGGLAWFYACWNLTSGHEPRKLALWGRRG